LIRGRGCEAFTAVTQLSLKSNLSEKHDAVRHSLLPEQEHLADITADSLSDQQLEKIAATDIDQLPLVDDHVRIGPPVADVRRIICIGLN
jgi:2-keto-4-pentenoate hydratase/2-oxohepta-3-ene-1,7-dioic acid hydratase in catechol pathway